jgi:sulfite reductase alpha subunit-like flavoprotein
MSVKVLWASQTGNCEEISLRLSQDLKSRSISNTRHCLQELGSSLSISTSDLLIFIVSSTGDGELPDNGTKFLKWIKLQEGSLLTGLRFTILGLGDSNYSTFQGGPKLVEKHLKRLGAQEFYIRGEADEQMGLENTIEPWIDGLWEVLSFELSRTLSLSSSLEIKAEDSTIVNSLITRKRVLSEKNTLKAIVELQLTIDQMYVPGTAILMYPQNNREKVERMLGYAKLDKSLNLSLSQIPKFLTHRCKSELTLLDYFTQFVDILSPLKSRTAWFLSTHLEDLEEKQDLQSYIDIEKLSMPAAYTLECILSQYKSWKGFEINELLENMPVLAGRNYSISSSPINSPGHITIVFTVTGLCTRYLNSIQNFNSRLQFALPLAEGSFWQGVKSAERVLIIATGTGISPFKGILEHLKLTQNKPVWVIYGCRNSVRGTLEQNFDHIYFEEINELVKPLGKVTVANSRSPVGPKYVQDAIEEQADEIYEWSETALLCGSFKTKEIQLKLMDINPNFKIFTEEWD